jgi:hypothetical protein
VLMHSKTNSQNLAPPGALPVNHASQLSMSWFCF